VHGGNAAEAAARLRPPGGNQTQDRFPALFDPKAKHEAASSSEGDVRFVVGEMSESSDRNRGKAIAVQSAAAGNQRGRLGGREKSASVV